MRERLLLLELSTRGINLRGSFLASQLDASCREEDQDRDTTVCESSSWWTRRFRSPGPVWSGPTGIKPIKLELPKKSKLSWSDERVVQALGHPHAKGVSPGEYARELFTRGENARNWLREALADPQGPTGLWSDLAADLAARLPFFSGKTAAQVVENREHYIVWWLPLSGANLD